MLTQSGDTISPFSSFKGTAFTPRSPGAGRFVGLVFLRRQHSLVEHLLNKGSVLGSVGTERIRDIHRTNSTRQCGEADMSKPQVRISGRTRANRIQSKGRCSLKEESSSYVCNSPQNIKRQFIQLKKQYPQDPET